MLTTVIIKAIIIILLLTILFALGSALYYLITDDKENSERIVRALTWRIGLSLALFALLFIAFALGLITPHSIS